MLCADGGICQSKPWLSVYVADGLRPLLQVASNCLPEPVSQKRAISGATKLFRVTAALNETVRLVTEVRFNVGVCSETVSVAKPMPSLTIHKLPLAPRLVLMLHDAAGLCDHPAAWPELKFSLSSWLLPSKLIEASKLNVAIGKCFII